MRFRIQMLPTPTIKYAPPPKLSELGLDLLHLTAAQRIFTLAQPFLFASLYFFAALTGHWAVALLAVIFLSFVTYGSVSHDLVHGNLGLPRPINEAFLSLIELLALRSGHAYRITHLYHHAHFPANEDIEAAAAKKEFWGAILDGTTFHFRLWVWALKRARKRERNLILIEGATSAFLIIASFFLWRATHAPLAYVVLMLGGAWITPLVTSYVPHDASGKNELEQTRVFRGRLLSILALEHLYHLEHHLYPSVPHQNWPKLAKRLDPYFQKMGIKPVRLEFGTTNQSHRTRDRSSRA
jgi:beta-carotene hydroxylase